MRLILAALLLPAALSAQAISLGVKAGLNSSRQVGWCCGEPNPFGPRRGVAAGVTATYRATPYLGFQTELLYAQKGMRGDFGFEMLQSYLELPVLVRAQLDRGSRVRPVLLAGLAPALEISCAGQTTLPTLGISPQPRVPIDCDQMRTYRGDVGYIGAVGADLRVDQMIWSAEMRYTHGSGNLTRGWDYIPRTTNRTWTLLLGVRRPSR